MSTAEEIDDEELEKLNQFAKAQGTELSSWLAKWRDAELAGYPAEAILTACLTASLPIFCSSASARNRPAMVSATFPTRCAACSTDAC
jgi:hypothetical protein